MTPPYTSSLSPCVSKSPPYSSFYSHYDRIIHQLFICKVYCRQFFCNNFIAIHCFTSQSIATDSVDFYFYYIAITFQFNKPSFNYLLSISTMKIKIPSTPVSFSNIAKLNTQKSSPDGSINPGLKKKSKGVVFNTTVTPQRDPTRAPAVTPTFPPKLQHQHRSQAGNDIWADAISTLISVTDSLSVTGGIIDSRSNNNKSDERSNDDTGGIGGIVMARHNSNSKETNVNDTGVISDSGHSNSKEKKEDGNNSNARSNDDKGGIGGIA